MKNRSWMMAAAILVALASSMSQAVAQTPFQIAPSNANYPVISGNNLVYVARLHDSNGQYIGYGIQGENLATMQPSNVYTNTDPDLFGVQNVSLNGDIATWSNVYSATDSRAWAEDLSGTLNGGQPFAIDPSVALANFTRPSAVSMWCIMSIILVVAGLTISLKTILLRVIRPSSTKAIKISQIQGR